MKTNRRKFVKDALKATAVVTVGSSILKSTEMFANAAPLQFAQVKLPLHTLLWNRTSMR
jgi:hypothetical protein